MAPQRDARKRAAKAGSRKVTRPSGAFGARSGSAPSCLVGMSIRGAAERQWLSWARGAGLREGALFPRVRRGSVGGGGARSAERGETRQKKRSGPAESTYLSPIMGAEANSRANERGGSPTECGAERGSGGRGRSRRRGAMRDRAKHTVLSSLFLACELRFRAPAPSAPDAFVHSWADTAAASLFASRARRRSRVRAEGIRGPGRGRRVGCVATRAPRRSDPRPCSPAAPGP